MAIFMRGKQRLVDMDPFDRQIAFLKIGLYSGSFFSVVLILTAMASQKKAFLGLIIAAIFLVAMLPLDYWIVQTTRRKRANRRSDLTDSPGSFSRRN